MTPLYDVWAAIFLSTEFTVPKLFKIFALKQILPRLEHGCYGIGLVSSLFSLHTLYLLFLQYGAQPLHFLLNWAYSPF